MNRKTYLFVICFSLLLFFTMIGCSSMMESVVKKQTAPEDEQAATEENEMAAAQPADAEQSGTTGSLEVEGSWVNTDYDGQGRSARVVYEKKADGSFRYMAYDNSDGSGNVYTGSVRYKETWTDAQGNRMGRSIVDLEGGMSWETLDRISADGSTLEVQSGVDEINPEGPRYSIYYRQ
jgi:hypothetical protein